MQIFLFYIWDAIYQWTPYFIWFYLVDLYLGGPNKPIAKYCNYFIWLPTIASRIGRATGGS